MKQSFIEKILNLLFPPACGFCGKLSASYVCDDCLKDIKALEKNVCQNYQTKKLENVKYHNNVNFEEHFWMFEYKDLIRDKIISYKFNNCSYLYKAFAEIICSEEKVVDYIKRFDYIVPVPIHKKRQKYRGYNQCALIAKEISKNIEDVEFCGNILIKQKSTKPQSTLNKEDRAKNVKGAFKLENSLDLDGKKVLIFDDIYTTGNTVNECARLLKEAKCSMVGVFSIAKD